MIADRDINSQGEEMARYNRWSSGVNFASSEKVDRARFPLWPHQSDLEAYEWLVKDGGTYENVLILGATPGLRDLAARYARKVLVADMNSLMLVSTSPLLQCADPNNEVWLHANWLELPLAQDSIDLVMGDLVWWFFPPKEQVSLMDKLTVWLRPRGLFISRFFFKPDAKDRDEDPFAVLSEYVERAVRYREQRHQIYFTAFLHLTGTLSDNDQEADPKRVADFVRSVADRFPQEEEGYLFQKAEQWELNPSFILQTRAQIEKSMKERFTLEREILPAKYAVAEMFPVLSWRLRS